MATSFGHPLLIACLELRYSDPVQEPPPEYRAHRCSFSPDRQSPYLRLNTVTVFVQDVERSLRFYLDQLGFTLAFDFLLPSGDRWIIVTPPDGTAMISLICPQPGTGEHQLIGRSTHACFLTEDISAIFNEWRQRGVHFHAPPQGQDGGPLSATFQDPDGNSFSLVAFDKLTEEIEQMRQKHIERRDFENQQALESEMARQTQAKLLPETAPNLRSLDCYGACFQAREVGGDYYDFLNLGRDRVGLVVGDVSGKGTAAALLMAHLQATMHNLCAYYWSRPYVPMAPEQPCRMLQTVNRLMYENTGAHAYVTLFFAEFDDSACRLRYANCGHPSALLLRGESDPERLDSTASVLGLSEGWTCAVVERQLSAGDTLAIYTDGVTEAFNDQGEEFGEERLAEALTRYRRLSAKQLFAAIMDEIHQFNPNQQSDDITLMVAKCK